MSVLDETGLEQLRNEMVRTQIVRRGVTNAAVLDAMREVPRHRFVPPDRIQKAYGDHPLPIGNGQTISQPYMVAYMAELLQPKPSDTVLEIGAGCGYAAAVLSRLVEKVFAVELVPELAEKARRNLQELGYRNVETACFDGSGGWPDKSPFDGILVSAGAPGVPQALEEQLSDGGRLVIPTGDQFQQTLSVVVRRGEEMIREEDILCRFVDLRGKHGWSA